MLYFPMFIATLSLVTSIYNGYLNNRFVEIIRHNVNRSEYIRTCKDIIDGYYLVKLKVSALSAAAERQRANRASDIIGYEGEAANAVSHFAALGTYLANFQDAAARERYTHLSWELASVAKAAREKAPAEVDKLFEKADGMFGRMNEDCIKTVQTTL
jgi:hypothetical protein